MDDPVWTWPFWKFGLRSDDLFSKLHDQYNTFPSAIQDPEAFHHDVCEISHEANTREEFHRLLADRRKQRLQELNESLESAALEIIANSSLIGSEQWQYALQLFRTKSLDSLVRYFSSYLPEDHPWHHAPSRSVSESNSAPASFATSHTFSFDHDDLDDEATSVEEPLPTLKTLPRPTPADQLPPSPRSMTMNSNSSAESLIDDSQRDYPIDSSILSRPLSFCIQTPDRLEPSDSDDEDTSQPCDLETMGSWTSDVETVASLESAEISAMTSKFVVEEMRETELGLTNINESETPTPKPQPPAASFFDSSFSLSPCQHRRSMSPVNLSHVPTFAISSCSSHTNYDRTAGSASRSRRRETDVGRGRQRKSVPGESAARVRKPRRELSSRTRPRDRRHAADDN